jgi:hypothetical protein
VSTARYYDDLMSQQEDYIHTMAARATMRAAAAQYDALMGQEEDAIHTIAAQADALANTVSVASAGAPVAVRECTYPSVGFPTCYSLQADGTWAREELAETDANWVVIGTVTYEEMRAAVGEVNASTP